MSPFPSRNSANFLDFRVTVDGREVQAQYEEKAVVDGTDISVRLKALGVPLAPQSEATTNALNALPPATQDELAKLKFVIVDEVDFGKGMQRDLTPIWTFKSTFYWSQTFPAGKEVVVEHRYTPSVGGTVGSFLDSTPIDPAQIAQLRSALLHRRRLPDRPQGRARKTRRERLGRAPVLRKADRLRPQRPAPTGPGRSAISISPSTRARPIRW